MNFDLTETEQRFRNNLRQWLQAHLPAGWGETVFEPVELQAKIAFLKDWTRKLHAAGYTGLSWPKAYGGAGATLMEQVIFNEEVARCKAPTPYNGIALGMVGPTLIEVGTEAQKQRYLANMLTAGDEAPVALALERMLAMRAYMRRKHVDGKLEPAILERVGLTQGQVEEMYRIMAIANYEDRFVIPTSHREFGANPYDERGTCGFSLSL